jgi:AAHS family 4-hydroxybenzoate transporter-like MFS transporter
MTVNLEDDLERVRVQALQYLIVVTVGMVMLLDGLDIQLAAFTAPLIIEEWSMTKRAFAPVLAAAMIGMVFGAIVGGWFGDRIGRRWTLIGCVLLFGTVTVGCSFAQSTTHLVLLRFIGGIGFGAVMPAAAAMLAEWMPKRAAGQAISVMAIGFPLGGMIGAAGASWILEHLGWRACFLIGGLPPILFALLMMAYLPETPAFLLRCGKQQELRRLLQGAWGKSGYEPAARYMLAAQIDEAGSTSHLLARENLRTNVGLWLTFFAHLAATYSILNWMPVLLTGLDMSIQSALRGSLVFNFGTIAGSIVVPQLILRTGSRATMLGLLCVAGVAVLGMVAAIRFLAVDDSLFHSIIYTSAGVNGFCMGALTTCLFAVAAHSYDAQYRSRGLGAASAFGRLGGIASTFAGGIVLSAGSESLFLLALLAVLAIAFVGTSIIDRHLGRTIRLRVSPATQHERPAASR